MFGCFSMVNDFRKPAKTSDINAILNVLLFQSGGTNPADIEGPVLQQVCQPRGRFTQGGAPVTALVGHFVIFNFIHVLPKVNTDCIRKAQVINFDNYTSCTI